MSEILNQQIRHYSGPELEMRRSSNRRDPVELKILRIRAEMVGRLGQTRVARLELEHHDVAVRIQAIEGVSATGNIDQVLKLLEGEPGEGGALEVAPDEAPRPLVGYVVPTCRVLGGLGMLGMLAVQTKLAQTGGEVLAEQIGFSPGVADGITWSVAVLSDAFSLRLFWDGIVGSAANIGEGIINYFWIVPSTTMPASCRTAPRTWTSPTHNYRNLSTPTIHQKPVAFSSTTATTNHLTLNHIKILFTKT